MIIIAPAKYVIGLARLICYIALALIVLKIFVEYWLYIVALIVIVFAILVITAPDPPPKPKEPPVLVSRTVVKKRAPSNPEELSQAQPILDIFRKAEEVVNASSNIELVDSRFGIMMDAGNELSKFLLPELLDVQRHFVNDLKPEKIFRTAAQRFIANQVSEISQLKTESEKSRRIEEIDATIDRLHNMPPEVKTYSKKLLRELLPIGAR